MVRVIPVRLDDEMVGFIDMLVELGIYSSRSEALRDLVKIGIEELRWMAKVNRAVDKLFELEEETGDIPVKVEGGLRQLLEERGRF
jgi:Arc/MetJ-type ribon-helix-helix transcriptional regulator